MNPKHWHANREEVFRPMRTLSATAEAERRRAMFLGPRGGTLAVGSADFDHTLKAEVVESYLGVLRRGGTPAEALAEAVQDGKNCVHLWNTNGCRCRVAVGGRHELHRSPESVEPLAMACHRMFADLPTSPEPECITFPNTPPVRPGSASSGPA